MKIDSLNPQKLFFIKEIKGNDKTVRDVLIVYSRILGPNTPTDDTYKCIAYYIDNNELWVKNTKRGLPRSATPQEIQEYQTYLQGITGQPQYISQATYHDAVGWDLPSITFPGPLPLSRRAIIETIETNPQTTLEDIFDTITIMQPDHAITLIRHVRTMQVGDTAPVLLTNVIVDGEHDRLLYTINGRFFDNNQELPHDYMPYYTTLLKPAPLFAMHQGSLLPVTITSEQTQHIKNALIQNKHYALLSKFTYTLDAINKVLEHGEQQALKHKAIAPNTPTNRLNRNATSLKRKYPDQ